MPIYEYRCHSCEKVFEYMQRMSDDPKTTCEECEGKLERLISQSAFHLKGGGWYKDLYSSTKKDVGGDSKSAASDSGSSSSDSKSGGDAKASTETKPSSSSGSSTSSSGGD